jgi:hypothetical protein
MAQGLPVRVVDSETQEAYVLFRATGYARLNGDLPRPVGQPDPGIPPLILRSMQAFWRALPQLLGYRRNRGKWVAYHGDEQVAITRDDVDAYQECFRRGLKRGEFYVGKIEASPDGLPPWGPVEDDWACYEVTEETLLNET